MQFQLNFRNTFSLLALGVVAATLAGAAVAADMPKRKPGLWEINMQMDGVPNMGPMQQCIDQNTDNLMQQQAKQRQQQVKPNLNRKRPGRPDRPRKGKPIAA